MKKSAFICILVISMTSELRAQTNLLADSVSSKIDSVINAQMIKKHIVGASMAIVDHGKMVYARGYGYADNRRKIKATEKTVFCIGSITKTFTAMAIMKLHEEGKIDLDKPASYYLPELKIKSIVENGDILKIKNLLSHTSGLPDGFMNKDMCANEQDMFSVIDDLNQEELVHKTNWKWSYSNVGYDILGCIVDRVSGMKYMDYIRKNFLQKMDMGSSDFFDRPNDTLYSKGYLKDTMQTKEPYMRDIPAGALFCSAPDMANFMNAILNKGNYGTSHVISQASIEDMQTDHTDHTMIPGHLKYGYATFMLPMQFAEDSLYGDAIGHGGDTHTFHAVYFVFPKIDFGVVILTNSENGNSFCNVGFVNIFKVWMKYESGQKLNPVKKHPKDLKTNTSNMLTTREIAGSYAIGEDRPLLIKRISNRKLLMKQNSQHIVLKRQKDGNYSFTLKLLGVVPIKIKAVEIGFSRIQGKIYGSQINKGNGSSELICVKDTPGVLSEAWKKAAGKYKLLNACDGNLQGIPQQIIVSGNKLFLRVSFGKKDVTDFSFDAIDDTHAAVDGIDRRSGSIMKILPNGHIYFSGYEMEKE